MQWEKVPSLWFMQKLSGNTQTSQKVTSTVWTDTLTGLDTFNTVTAPVYPDYPCVTSMTCWLWLPRSGEVWNENVTEHHVVLVLSAAPSLSLLRCEGFLKRVSCFYRCSPDAARWPHPHRRSYIQAVPLCHSFCRDWWGCQTHCHASLNQNLNLSPFTYKSARREITNVCTNGALQMECPINAQRYN